ncbi:MAG TPA: hypothetical protein VIU40_11040 [Geobacteraceae bacterium]
MKRNRTILALTAVAMLTLAGQAFARGGSFGGGAGSASRSGSHLTASTMTRTGGSGMTTTAGSHQGKQSGAMARSTTHQGAMTGTGASGTMPTTTMTGSGRQQGQMQGTGSTTTN